VQGPKGHRQRPERLKSRPNAEAGLGSGGGALSPSPPAKESGECCKLPQQGSRQSRDSPMIFHCFGHWKMPLLNKKCD